jgi:hypothetical protein
VTWYLLRIAPGTTPGYLLTRVPIPDMRSWAIESTALSGSGRELAMALIPAGPGFVRQRVIQIYSVATGKLLHSWSASNQFIFLPGFDAGGVASRALSWADGDRFVAFPAYGAVSSPHYGTKLYQTQRLLDVAARGSDLIADSRVLWSEPLSPAAPAPCSSNVLPLVSADAKTVVCAGVIPAGWGKQPRNRMTLRWLAYSTSAPQVARTAYQVTVAASSIAAASVSVLWASASGGTLIVAWSVDLSPASHSAWPLHVGMVRNGTFTPLLPISTRIAWSRRSWRTGNQGAGASNLGACRAFLVRGHSEHGGFAARGGRGHGAVRRARVRPSPPGRHPARRPGRGRGRGAGRLPRPVPPLGQPGRRLAPADGKGGRISIRFGIFSRRKFTPLPTPPAIDVFMAHIAW